MKIAFADARLPSKGVVTVMVLEGGKMTASAKALDKSTDGALSRAIKAGRFDGKAGQTLWVFAPAGLEKLSILMVGVGAAKSLDVMAFRKVGAAIVRAANAEGAAELAVMLDPIAGGKLEIAERAAELGYGAKLARYRFDRYLTKDPAEKKPSLEQVSVHVKSAAPARRAFASIEPVAEAVDFTRNIVSEPGNIIYPETLARKASQIGQGPKDWPAYL